MSRVFDLAILVIFAAAIIVAMFVKRPPLELRHGLSQYWTPLLIFNSLIVGFYLFLELLERGSTFDWSFPVAGIVITSLFVIVGVRVFRKPILCGLIGVGLWILLCRYLFGQATF